MCGIQRYTVLMFLWQHGWDKASPFPKLLPHTIGGFREICKALSWRSSLYTVSGEKEHSLYQCIYHCHDGPLYTQCLEKRTFIVSMYTPLSWRSSLYTVSGEKNIHCINVRTFIVTVCTPLSWWSSLYTVSGEKNIHCIRFTLSNASAADDFWKHCGKRRIDLSFRSRLLQICCMWERLNTTSLSYIQ